MKEKKSYGFLLVLFVVLVGGIATSEIDAIMGVKIEGLASLVHTISYMVWGAAISQALNIGFQWKDDEADSLKN